MKSYSLSLPPKSDILKSILKISNDEKLNGFVLGIIGNLSSAAIRCPGSKGPLILREELEIISLNGTVSPGQVHLHICISDRKCHVWGGHLEVGSNVLKNTEILFGLHGKDTNKSSINTLHDSLEIAVIPGCPWSHKALQLIRNLRIDYQVICVDNDDKFNIMNSRSGMKTFPQIFFNGILIGGFDDFMLDFQNGRFNTWKK